MSAYRNKTILKYAPLVLLAALHGCATRVAAPEMAAYRECVHAQAMELIDTPGSANEVALLAATQCQGNLALINEKLRQENAWMDWYGSNSDAYTEGLRDRVIADVTEKIRAARLR